MPISEAQQRAVNKYAKKNYDEVKFLVKKGNRDVIKQHASSMNESTSAFIKRAIAETMERDNLKKDK